MTSSLETLKFFPTEEGGNFSEDMINFITKLATNFNTLNEEKAGLADTNTYTEENTFSKNTVLSGGMQTGKTSVTSTPTTITNNQGFIGVTTSSEEIALTLPQTANIVGKEIIICLESDGGYNAVISCYSGDTVNAAGNNTITLDDADDFIHLKALASGRWLILNNSGGSLSTV